MHAGGHPRSAEARLPHHGRWPRHPTPCPGGRVANRRTPPQRRQFRRVTARRTRSGTRLILDTLYSNLFLTEQTSTDLLVRPADGGRRGGVSRGGGREAGTDLHRGGEEDLHSRTVRLGLATDSFTERRRPTHGQPPLPAKDTGGRTGER
jgi:hypothetical protein